MQSEQYVIVQTMYCTHLPPAGGHQRLDLGVKRSREAETKVL